MDEAIRKKCVSTFEQKGHKAFPVLINEDYWIVDWRKAEGGNDYAIRYTIDLKQGNLIITGDLGDCIASWYNEVEASDMARYVQSIGYFISKMQCTSDKYTYKWHDVQNDLNEIKEDYLKNLDDYDIHEDLEGSEREEAVIEDFDDMESILEEMSLTENTAYPRDLVELFEKYNTDWWESDFIRLGQRINQRVYLWAVGLDLAYEQIKEAGV